MPTKRGIEIAVGDMIFVGIGRSKTGRIKEFLPHPQFAERNKGLTARVAVTDRGAITVIDQQPTEVPA
ncbi:hypothetical protein [Stutzerimonas nitrititolerans]|uniref:hypothetical protein n=1 Tax=Stutzerimonas nitrititolerans TaxID=2482751 RepID=UPI002898EA78|nr:hypothetical protein [Stutzerimonas nitrititolerans]